MNRTGYDYIPTAGEDYYPQGKPAAEDRSGQQLLASGTDSDLVKNAKGDVVITDKKGNRRV